MREIILDTETTGLDPNTGDRLVEIGGIELINTMPTSNRFQHYLDPQRDMPLEAFNVHGLTAAFLKGKPQFEEIADKFLAFIGDARLVIHNAEFDMRFLNFELKRAGRPPIGMERVTDTLALARRKHPGQPNSLDALCARYHIDNSKRSDAHGALVDALILAEVYAELTGGRQTSMLLGHAAANRRAAQIAMVSPRPSPLPSRLTAQERAAHAAFIAELGDKAAWKIYDSAPA